MFDRIITKRSLLVAACLACAALVTSAVAEDWPIYRGPSHDGISTETGWYAQGAKSKVLWTKDIGRACSSMTIVGNVVYTMGNKANKDYVYCFNAANGSQVWEFRYDEKLDPKNYEGGPNATPTIDGGHVLTLSKTGKVFCLDASSGKKIWEVQLDTKKPTWGYAGSILPLGDKLILNAGNHGTALDRKTGKVLWESGKGPGGYSTPVPYEKDGKTLVCLFTAKNVLAVNPDNGKVVWSYAWKTSWDVNAADPVILDGGKKVFVSSGYNHGSAMLDISGPQPKEIWSNKDMRNKHTNSVVYKGAIYGFSESKTLVCLNEADGKVLWTRGGFGLGSLMIADGKVIILSDKGVLVIADASHAGFKELTSGTVVKGPCWTVPVLANGRIYCRSKTGMLSCSTVK